MKVQQGFKFRIEPNGQQRGLMQRYAGCCRFVYNKALVLQTDRYKAGEKKLGYAELCKHLTAWRRASETSWLADAPMHPLQQSLKDLSRAYVNFFAKRADLPTFKKRGIRDSFRYPDPKQIKLDQDNSRIYLPKLGWIRYRNSRKVEADLCNVTVSRSGGHWYIAIQTECDVSAPIHPAQDITGIDRGIARFATLADGTFHLPLNSFRKLEAKLSKAQRKLSRRIKFSNNWKKQKEDITRIHQKIANARHDFLHKLSTSISKNHAVIVLEDLQIGNMSKSARGTVDSPGRNVKAKSGLNKSILDQGWGMFARFLDYKQLWRGGWTLYVPPHNTSRTCPDCGHISADNRQTQSSFECVSCGYSGNADHVAAMNIKAEGLAVLACGDALPVRAMAQEPAEGMAFA